VNYLLTSVASSLTWSTTHAQAGRSGWLCGLDTFRPSGYWITSSAMANSVSGMVRPSALAVFRLMTSSSFVDCWTGRSAGFSPLRMRST
jgi:hypothetical protein